MEHLPEKVYDLLLPLTVSTCQGFYAVTMMLSGAMPALANGAGVKLWNQRSTPLTAVVFQIATPQKGKSRIVSVIEEMFDTCDDVVQDMLKAHALKLSEDGDVGSAQPPSIPGEGHGGEAAQAAGARNREKDLGLTVKSISLQSFTFPEFFYRCSSEDLASWGGDACRHIAF